MISKEILGVRVDFGLTMDEVLNLIEKLYLKDDRSRYICTTNPEFIMDAQEDGRFKNIINKSDLSVPDGIGVILAKKYLEKVKKAQDCAFHKKAQDCAFHKKARGSTFHRKTQGSTFHRKTQGNTFHKEIQGGGIFHRKVPTGIFRGGKRWFFIKAFIIGISVGVSHIFKNTKDERITGVDLTYKLCEIASKKGYTVFFLGGRPKNFFGKHKEIYQKEMAVLTAEKLQELYPGLNVIGATSKFSREQRDDKDTLNYIKLCMKEKGISHIDFLFVAYNHNWQEKWIVRNSYKIPAKVSVGLGGTFDYIMGHNKLPPNILVKMNLGWLYRLITQPWRMKRIFKAFPSFPLKVYKNSINSK